VLDGHAGRALKLRDQVPGGLGVQVVVEAHGLALEDPGLQKGPLFPINPVKGRFLVRVFPVAQGAFPPEDQKLLGGELLPGKPLGNGGVVAGGVGEGLAGKLPAELKGRAFLEGLKHPRVVLRVAHGQDRHVVLGRRPEHGGAPDVDLLQGLGEIRPPGHRLPEGVEVHRQDPDPLKAQGLELLLLVGPGEKPRMHLGVEGLDPALEDLGKTREVRDVGDGKPRLHQGPVGAPRGQEPITQA